MNHTIYISDEDCTQLKSVFAFIGKLVFAIDQAKQEEELERQVSKKFDGLNSKSAFNLILKELKKMPKWFKEIFNEEWFNKHIRQKDSGIYELRCSINKVPYYGSGKTINIAAENFVKDILKDRSESAKTPKVKKILFNDFAEKWFKLVKKPTIKANTYENYYNVFTVHIKPYFRNKFVVDLTAMQIQPLFTKLYNQKKRKSIKDVATILNQIFNSAIGERIIERNPMNEVKVLRFQSKKGTALTYAEEAEFLKKIVGHDYELAFVLLLFGGMRRGELRAAKIENGFIIVKDGKRRLAQAETERKIPITPMLERYLSKASKKQFKDATKSNVEMLTRHFKELCPAHHLHELRHTFITRCQECGIYREIVSVWAGHAADRSMTSNVYTHFSDEFMLNEGKKVDYFSRLYNS